LSDKKYIDHACCIFAAFDECFTAECGSDINLQYVEHLMKLQPKIGLLVVFGDLCVPHWAGWVRNVSFSRGLGWVAKVMDWVWFYQLDPSPCLNDYSTLRFTTIDNIDNSTKTTVTGAVQLSLHTATQRAAHISAKLQVFSSAAFQGRNFWRHEG